MFPVTWLFAFVAFFGSRPCRVRILLCWDSEYYADETLYVPKGVRIETATKESQCLRKVRGAASQVERATEAHGSKVKDGPRKCESFLEPVCSAFIKPRFRYLSARVIMHVYASSVPICRCWLNC